MRLAPALRARDRDRAIARRKRELPDTYAPFSIDEYRGMPLDYNYLDQCVGWPVSPAGHPASRVVPRNAVYPDIPALIISGELDDITSVAEGAAVAQAFKHGRQVVIANSFHVNALPRARSACGAKIVRRFIASLSPGDTRCAARVPPLVLVPEFAERSADLAPARALPGNRADARRLRLAAATVMTLGDVLVRAAENSTGTGPGLRGGSFHILRRGHDDPHRPGRGALDGGSRRQRRNRCAHGGRRTRARARPPGCVGRASEACYGHAGARGSPPGASRSPARSAASCCARRRRRPEHARRAERLRRRRRQHRGDRRSRLRHRAVVILAEQGRHRRRDLRLRDRRNVAPLAEGLEYPVPSRRPRRSRSPSRRRRAPSTAPDRCRGRDPS